MTRLTSSFGWIRGRKRASVALEVPPKTSSSSGESATSRRGTPTQVAFVDGAANETETLLYGGGSSSQDFARVPPQVSTTNVVSSTPTACRTQAERPSDEPAGDSSKPCRLFLLAVLYTGLGMLIAASSDGRRTWRFTNVHRPLPWLVSLPFLLVPAVVALGLRKQELKFELIAAGADTASDIFGLLTSRFYKPTVAMALFYFITVSPLIGVLGQFGLSILSMCVYDMARLLEWCHQRLGDYGLHQVFEDTDATYEKCVINVAVSCCLLFAPVVLLPLCVAKAIVFILLGTCLHSVRLMQVPCVARFFAHLGAAAPASSDTLEAPRADMAPEWSEADEIRSHNHAMLVELVFESIPSLGLNAANLYALSHVTTSNETPWMTYASMCVSCYMMFRLAYKFVFHHCIQGKRFDELDVDPSSSLGAAGSVGPYAWRAAQTALT